MLNDEVRQEWNSMKAIDIILFLIITLMPLIWAISLNTGTSFSNLNFLLSVVFVTTGYFLRMLVEKLNRKRVGL